MICYFLFYYKFIKKRTFHHTLQHFFFFFSSFFYDSKALFNFIPGGLSSIRMLPFSILSNKCYDKRLNASITFNAVLDDVYKKISECSLANAAPS